jgi:hypothetical protein
VIKESIKEPIANCEIRKCNNVLQTLEVKTIDNMHYSLYEWIPHSLERFLAANPQLINKGFAAHLVHTLVRVYGMLWRTCEGNGLDITAENIRAISRGSYGIVVKVFPPSITCCNFPQRKVLYRNRINDLGEALYSILRGSLKEIGAEVPNFINKHMRGPNIPTNAKAWEDLENLTRVFVSESELGDKANRNNNARAPIQCKDSSV